MAIKYSFVDGALYGTEDINDIATSLVGAGVMPFLSKESYNVSDLNVMTSALVESGTSLDGCKCSVKDTGTEKMTVRVAQGIVFFECGVRLEVDEEGYTVAVTPNTAGHIYANYSPALQKVDIVFGAEFPTDGEYVVLARLEEDGSLKDERIFARSKIATMGNNVVHAITEDRITVYENYTVAPRYDDTGIIIADIDLSGIDVTKFNYLIYKYQGYDYDGNITDLHEKQFDFKNNAEKDFCLNGTLYWMNARFKIIATATKFIVVVDTAVSSFETYVSAFKSAIPYFKLV